MFISKRQRQFVLLAVFCGIVLLVTAIPLQADETKIPDLNVSEQQNASSAEALAEAWRKIRWKRLKAS